MLFFLYLFIFCLNLYHICTISGTSLSEFFGCRRIFYITLQGFTTYCHKKALLRSPITMQQDNGIKGKDRTFYFITEASRMLGVSRPTIYARIRSGELQAIQVAPRTIRISIEELKAQPVRYN